MFEPSDRALRIVRGIRAPRADVFDAWVNPERLPRWWGPPGVRVAKVVGDLRIGGRYRILMYRDGDEIELEWTFLEIEPPQRLVFAWRFTRGEGEPREQSVVRIVFRSSRRGTEIELTHEGIVSTDARESHAEGWIGCLDGLGAILNQLV